MRRHPPASSASAPAAPAAALALAATLALVALIPVPVAAAPFQVVVNTVSSTHVRGGGSSVVVMHPQPQVTVFCSPTSGLVCQSHVRGNQVIVNVFHNPGVIHNVHRWNSDAVTTESSAGDATEMPELSQEQHDEEVEEDDDSWFKSREEEDEKEDNSWFKSREEEDEKEDNSWFKTREEEDEEEGEEEEVEEKEKEEETEQSKEPEDPSNTVDGYDDIWSTERQPNRVRESRSENYKQNEEKDDDNSTEVTGAAEEGYDDVGEYKTDGHPPFGSNGDRGEVSIQDTKSGEGTDDRGDGNREAGEEDGSADAKTAGEDDYEEENHSRPPSEENETDNGISFGWDWLRPRNENGKRSGVAKENNGRDADSDDVETEPREDTIESVNEEETEPNTVNNGENGQHVEATTRNELLTGNWWQCGRDCGTHFI